MDRHREALERMYSGRCSVFEHEKILDNFETQLCLKQMVQDEPCYLSRLTLKPSSQSDAGNIVEASFKLFLKPDIFVLPGCKVEVWQDNRFFVFESCGEPHVFRSHQEIYLRTVDYA